LNPNRTLIIIDSNFILLPFQFKIDYLHEIRLKLEGELRFVIFKQILNELEAKKRRESNSTKFARLLDSGLGYLESKKEEYEIDILNDIKNLNETTDEFLLKKILHLKNEGYRTFLATNDSDLRRKARLANVNSIFLRQKKYLVIERA
jgi:rRNA-processing protein FCF1